MRIGLDANRHLLDDFKTVAFEADNFLGIVGQQPDRFQPQVAKNLRAQAVLAQIHRVAEFPVRFDRIKTLFLQFVSFDFWRESNPPPFLPHVNNDSLLLVRHLAHRLVQLRPAIASFGSKHIAGQTLAVHAHQDIFFAVHLPTHQSQVMLAIHLRAV